MAEAGRIELPEPFGVAGLANLCCTIEPRFQTLWHYFNLENRMNLGVSMLFI